jgi:1,3-beta-glucanosyltransferase GAS3
LKNYIAKHASRAIPVGYAAAQVQDILQNQWNYFQCALPNAGNDDPSRSDFFALNSYSWCGNSSYTTSGYDKLVSWFSNTTIPVFFGEYGCNQIPDGTSRPFTEVQALYGEPMREVFSGGLVFEWTQETNVSFISIV